MDKRYYILTYGCQMNKHDSEVMAGVLEREGFLPATSLEEADVILLNTCSVREHAENRVFGVLGQLKRLKRNGVVLGLCGCMAQRYGERLLERFPQLDIVCGTYRVGRIGALVREAMKGVRVVDIADEDEPAFDIRKVEDDLHAWVVVSLGCENFCTYCVVPYTRGPVRSRGLQEIVDEVRRLDDQGIREITLLGQNVVEYGRDLQEGVDFVTLLEKVHDACRGIERIRFVTSHPRDVDERLLRAVAELPKVCEYLHLPVQAGSDKILKLMNRGYTHSQYIDLVDMARDIIPGVGITTDIIVGFPGEEEEDFQKTLQLVERVRFDSAYMFKFSPREGTPAAKMGGQVSEEIKQRRLECLIKTVERIAKERNTELVGEKVEVLVEGGDEKREGFLRGRTRNFKLTVFPHDGNLRGRLVDVRVREVGPYTLIGEIEGEVG